MSPVFMKNQALFLLLLSSATTIFAENDEERYESTAHICSRCSCVYSDDQTELTLNCANKSFTRVLSEWPKDSLTSITTSFSYNSIETLAALPGTYARLKVSFDHCGIKNLEPGIFGSAVNVTYADFSYNQLISSALSGDVFKGPYNNTIYEPIALRYLNLAYNQIHSLQKDVFEHTPFLEVLNLEGNDFRVLDPVTQLAISSVPKIRILNLANNRLTDLTENAIKQLGNLQDIDLSRNELDFVPETLSFVAKTLEKLRVDHNPIVELNDNSFVGLTNLRVVSANNLTQLRTVKGNTFAPLTKLEVLSLAQCSKLAEIDRQAFGDHPNLREVYLNDNVLRDLDADLLPWSSLAVLRIQGNQLFCTCDLYNISTRVPDTMKLDQDGPQCLDSWKYISYQVYSLQIDVCSDQPTTSRRRGDPYTTDFDAVKISLVVLSVVLLVSMAGALVLGWSKWRSYQRNRNYPFVSNVIYNPINTSPSQFGPW